MRGQRGYRTACVSPCFTKTSKQDSFPQLTQVPTCHCRRGDPLNDSSHGLGLFGARALATSAVSQRGRTAVALWWPKRAAHVLGWDEGAIFIESQRRTVEND